MALKLQNKESGEVIDPRVDDFALSPADLGDFDNWDDALAQHAETDLIEGFAVIDGGEGKLTGATKIAATKLLTALEFAEVSSKYEPDCRRIIRDERIALASALRSGNAAEIAAARDEALRVCEMWGVQV